MTVVVLTVTSPMQRFRIRRQNHLVVNVISLHHLRRPRRQSLPRSKRHPDASFPTRHPDTIIVPAPLDVDPTSSRHHQQCLLLIDNDDIRRTVCRGRNAAVRWGPLLPSLGPPRHCSAVLSFCSPVSWPLRTATAGHQIISERLGHAGGSHGASMASRRPPPASPALSQRAEVLPIASTVDSRATMASSRRSDGAGRCSIIELALFSGAGHDPARRLANHCPQASRRTARGALPASARGLRTFPL